MNHKRQKRSFRSTFFRKITARNIWHVEMLVLRNVSFSRNLSSTLTFSHILFHGSPQSGIGVMCFCWTHDKSSNFHWQICTDSGIALRIFFEFLEMGFTFVNYITNASQKRVSTTQFKSARNLRSKLIRTSLKECLDWMMQFVSDRRFWESVSI